MRLCTPSCGAITNRSPWPSSSALGSGCPPSCGWLPPPPNCRLLELGQNVAGPSRDGHRDAAAVSVDRYSPGGGGAFPVPGGVYGARMPRAPTQGAPPLLPRYSGGTASRASPGLAHPPQGAPWGHGPFGATRPGDQPPKSAGPRDSQGVWFHDVPALATLRGNVVAVDAGTTQGAMAMARVVQSGPEAYQAQVASGVGTSQEGEAMALLSYARRPATQPGVYWLVPNSEAVVGAPRTYQEGGLRGDGIHHLYATVLGGGASPRGPPSML